MIKQLALLIFFSIILASPTFADTIVEECGSITDPGDYYLTGNLNFDASAGPCIVINEPTGNVFLDGRGFTIDNSAGSSDYSAISISSASDDIVIWDLTITDIQDDYAITMMGTMADVLLDEITISSSKGGMYLYSFGVLGDLDVTDCDITTTSYGIFAYGFGKDDVGLHGNTVTVSDTDGAGTPYGIFVSTGVSGMWIKDNVVDVEGDASGIYISSTDSVVIESNANLGNVGSYIQTIDSVDGVGIRILNSNGCYIRGLNVTTTGNDGILLYGTTSGTTIDSIIVNAPGTSTNKAIEDLTASGRVQTAFRIQLRDGSHNLMSKINWVASSFLQNLDVEGDITVDRLKLGVNHIETVGADWSATDLTKILGTEVDLTMYQTPASGIGSPVLTKDGVECESPECFDISSLALATVTFSSLDVDGNFTILNESDVGGTDEYGYMTETYIGFTDPSGLCTNENLTISLIMISNLTSETITDQTGWTFGSAINGDMNSEGVLFQPGEWLFYYNGTTEGTDTLTFYYNDTDWNISNYTIEVQVDDAYCDLEYITLELENTFSNILYGETKTFKAVLYDLNSGLRILDAINNLVCSAYAGTLASTTCSVFGDGECTMSYTAPLTSTPYEVIQCYYHNQDYWSTVEGFSPTVGSAGLIDMWIESDSGGWNLPSGPSLCLEDEIILEISFGRAETETLYGDGILTVTASSGTISNSPCDLSTDNPCSIVYDARATEGNDLLTFSYTGDSNYGDINYQINVDVTEDCHFIHLITVAYPTNERLQGVLGRYETKAGNSNYNGNLYITGLNPTEYPVIVDLSKSGYGDISYGLDVTEIDSDEGIQVKLYPADYDPTLLNQPYQDQYAPPVNTSEVTGGIKKIVYSFMASPFNILLMLIIILIAIGAIKLTLMAVLG